MFAVIETNGANAIVIAIDPENAAQAMPALARMLESNAVFVQSGWSENKVVEPRITFQLGHEFTLEGRDAPSISVATGAQPVIGEEFTPYTPEVYTSAKKQLATRDDEIRKLRKEAEMHKAQAELLQERVEMLESEAEAARNSEDILD